MSRRPNRDPLPLHKPEAHSKHCDGLRFRNDVTLLHRFARAPLTIIDDVYGWSLTYVATPIAVAVREALFTSSGLTNSTCRGVQSSLQCTAPFCSASLGSDSSYLVSLCAMY